MAEPGIWKRRRECGLIRLAILRSSPRLGELPWEMPSDTDITRPKSQRMVSAGQFRPSEVRVITSTWFWPVLASLTAVGIVVRILFVSLARFPNIANDAKFFRETAHNLVSGQGYAYPFPTHPAKSVATAAHPPLFSLVLSFFDIMGLDSIQAQRVALAVVSSVTVVLVGLVGRRVFGPSVGVVAAGIAALHPLWLQTVGSLMSESIYLIAIPLVLLMALRAADDASGWHFVALGVAIGVAALIRSEAIILVLLLGVPVLLFSVAGWKPRLRLAAALLLGCLLLVGPWVARNEIQLGTTATSTQEGLTLVGSYNPYTFNPRDPSFGSFNGFYADAIVGLFIKDGKPAGGGEWNEVNLNHVLTQGAEKFARSHLGALPRVILAREVSTWFLTGMGFQQNVAVTEGENPTFEILGGVVFWVLAVPAVVGSVVLWTRSRRHLVVLLVPIILVVLDVALTLGQTRFQIAAQPSLAVLASVGAVAVVRRMRAATH